MFVLKAALILYLKCEFEMSICQQWIVKHSVFGLCNSKRFFELLFKALFTAIVMLVICTQANAAAYPEMQLRSYTIAEQSISKLNVIEREIASSLLVDCYQITWAVYQNAKSSADQQHIAGKLKVYSDYYFAALQKMKPNVFKGDYFKQSMTRKLDAISGKNGEAPRLKALNDWKDATTSGQCIVAMVASGMTQADFAAFTSWDKAGQPNGGPNWAKLSTKSSTNPTTQSTPAAPSTDRRVLENRLGQINHKYFELLGVAIFLMQDDILNDNAQKILREHIKQQSANISGEYNKDVKAGYGAIQSRLNELKSRNQLTQPNIEAAVRTYLLNDFDTINNKRMQLIAEIGKP